MSGITLADLSSLTAVAQILRTATSVKDHFVEAFADIRYDGADWLTLEIAGRNLQAVSRFRVRGSGATPWSARVSINRLHTAIPHLGGGRFDISAVNGSFCLSKGQFRLVFPQVRTTPSGFQQINPIAGGLTLPAMQVASAMEFVSLGQGTGSPLSAGQYSSWFTDGVVGSTHRRIDFAARLPVIPFDMHLRRTDCRNLARWLRVVAGGTDIRLVDITGTHSTRAYFCETLDGNHCLWIAPSPQQYLKQVILPVMNETPAWVIKVDRQELWRLARLFGKRKGACSASLRFLAPSQTLEIESPSGHGALPVVPEAAPIAAGLRQIHVPAGSLAQALHSIRDTNVYLALRTQTRRLGISSAKHAYTGSPDREVFIRCT